MKNSYTNKPTATALLTSFAFLSLSAFAGGQDETQRHILQ